MGGGYKIFRNNRNVLGGAVAIYMKDSLDAPEVGQQMNSLELLSLDIKPKKARPFFLISWYRPPATDVDDSTFQTLRAILTRLNKQDKELILIRDTNCDLMDNKNANAKRLKQVYSEFQLEQLIETYTRVVLNKGHLSKSHHLAL